MRGDHASRNLQIHRFFTVARKPGKGLLAVFVTPAVPVQRRRFAEPFNFICLPAGQTRFIRHVKLKRPPEVIPVGVAAKCV